VFNTHLDLVGSLARERSAALILSRMQPHAESDRLLLTGDFNSRPDAPPYRLLTSADADPSAFRLFDAREVAQEPPAGPDSTWNGFRQVEPGERIDFVFTHRDDGIRRHAILDDSRDGRFPSDHLPVLVEFA
jgi:endonuclease/exonuclease/phosphatase family metal-dependent hydrolase